MPYSPYPDRWRALSYLRRQQKFYRSAWLLRPVVRLTGAREQLFDKVRDLPDSRAAWWPGAVSRRIAAMTDQQVDAALAMSEEEIEEARGKADEAARWAPAADPAPVALWYH